MLIEKIENAGEGFNVPAAEDRLPKEDQPAAEVRVPAEVEAAEGLEERHQVNETLNGGAELVGGNSYLLMLLVFTLLVER